MYEHLRGRGVRVGRGARGAGGAVPDCRLEIYLGVKTTAVANGQRQPLGESLPVLIPMNFVHSTSVAQVSSVAPATIEPCVGNHASSLKPSHGADTQ